MTQRQAAPPATSSPVAYAISLASICEATKRIEGLAHRTPVLTCSALDAVASSSSVNDDVDGGVRVRLFFKCENLQKIGAFKYRGALNAVKKALESSSPHDNSHQEHARPTTFVTQSSGNHAQAVALAARDAGCKAVIVMPTNAPVVKINAVRGYGAQVVFSDWTIESREVVAAEWVERTQGHFIHPSNDADVMSGQGTAALEMLEQVEAQYGVQLDAVLVPVGGGGLCSGTAMAVKSTNPAIKVFGVEPEGAADAFASFSSGQLQGHTKTPDTIADGLRSVLGSENFPVIRDLVDGIVLVSDAEIVASMKLMWERTKLVVEPSGATSVAAALCHKLPLVELAKGMPVVNIGIVVSGGNVDLDQLPWIQHP